MTQIIKKDDPRLQEPNQRDYISDELRVVQDEYRFDNITKDSLHITEDWRGGEFVGCISAYYRDFIFIADVGRLEGCPEPNQQEGAVKGVASWRIDTFEEAKNFILHLELQNRKHHLEMLRVYPDRFNGAFAGRDLFRNKKTQAEIFADQIMTILVNKARRGVDWAFKAIAEYDREYILRKALEMQELGDCTSDSEALLYAFDWSTSKDGNEYWEEIRWSVNQYKTLYKW